MTRVRVHNKVGIRSRLDVLTSVMSELILAFGADDICKNTIIKGVKERQIIEAVNLFYHDKDDKIQGLITQKIDWEKHEVNVNNPETKTFQFNLDIPLFEQIDHSIKVIVKYVSLLRKNIGIEKISVTYVYRDIYKIDENKYNEALKYLNHELSSHKPVEANDEFDKELKICLGKLDELEIKIEYNKP